ncbi:MAG: DNA gyrase inhibitor YacG [Myxococcales bacterium]|nr:DNA gyrase inhibitor YacG [Myxococcales bacterium]
MARDDGRVTFRPVPRPTCPSCGEPLPITPVAKGAPGGTDRSFFPFCSARCRQLDLGNWLDERYRVPGASHVDADPFDEN